MVRKEKDDFLAVHELAAANCLIRVIKAKLKKLKKINNLLPKNMTGSPLVMPGYLPI